MGAKFILRDKVLDKLEKLYYFARRKGGHSRIMSSKLCLNLEAIVKSFIAMIHRGGHDQLMDILLIGWW